MYLPFQKHGSQRLSICDYASPVESGFRHRERHRHRFEFNNHYREQIEAAGFKLSGTSPDGRLVEIIEVEDHHWFVASQFHPEFKSKPTKAHPLFAAFVGAAVIRRTGRKMRNANADTSDSRNNQPPMITPQT